MLFSARKQLAFTLALLLALQLAPARAWCAPAPPETDAVSAVLMDAYSGKILYQKNPDQRVAPASVTKVMTMLVAMDALAKGKVKWDDRITAGESAWEMGGSEIWLEPGESMSFREMMLAIAVGSANDACVAVADHIAGSEQAYVALMNEKAQSLGCKNTHFANVHGLPAKDHYTSAYDMALICREALKYPALLQLTSVKHYYELRGGKTRLDNTNKLLWYYDGADGFKTGWTSEANYCLASTVKRGDLRLICTVFGVPETGGNFRESTKLYNWAFANYGFQTLANEGQIMGRVPVGSGAVETVEAAVPRSVGVLIAKGEKTAATIEVRLPVLVAAPVRKGSQLGEIRVVEQGQVLETVPLLAQEDVARGSFWQELDRSFRSLMK